MTVVVITRNSGLYLARCLEALRRQTVAEIEIVVVDDCSDDSTAEVVRGIEHQHLIYTRNICHEGRPRSRNRGIQLANGNVIFFTDADCVPIRTWIEEGLRIFRDKNCVGVEGRTLSSNMLTLAHRSVMNDAGGQWQTCNIAYRRDILIKVGGFDERYIFAYEDRDLALRILQHGPIEFCPDMLVFHAAVPWTWRGVLNNAMRGRDRVRLIVEHNDRAGLWGIVVEPRSLIVLLCPIVLLFYHQTRSLQDLRAVGLLWIRAVVQRVVIWRAAWKTGRLLL